MHILNKLMKKLTDWFKKANLRLIHYVLLLYIFFIPLWPKLPFKTVSYTYIAIRYEDLFVVLIVLVFLYELIRGRVKLFKNPLWVWITLYWVEIFISFLVGFYIFKSIITLQLGFLNAARRVEYMIVFFIAFAALENKQQFLLYLRSIVLVFFMVSVYGLGQKFFGWPAVQTMNPAYSKGFILILDGNSRISSTFGGHYDFAAFLVFLMPVVLTSFIASKKWWRFLVFVVALTALIVTASRVSFVAYLTAIIPLLIYLKKPKLLVSVIALTLILMPVSNNLTQRIKRTFQQQQIWVDQSTGKTVVPRTITVDDLPPGDFTIGKQTTGALATTVTSGDIAEVKQTIREAIMDSAQKSGKVVPVDQLNKMVDDAFARLKPASSIVADISFATRLQVEWPRAVKAFIKSPLVGLGPSSITEATDNDFLRSIGESGILGFALFFGTIAVITKKLWQQRKSKNRQYSLILIGIIFGTWGLIVNAAYIDVFEASKVALFIWLVWGLMIKSTLLPQKEIEAVTI